MTYAEIAERWTAWTLLVDPMATMTPEEFDQMSVEEKIQIQIECFGPESD